MLNVAVCDDERMICSFIERVILDYSNRELGTVQVDVFESGAELMSFMQQNVVVDMIFLDIELGLIQGVDVAKFIRDELKNEMVKIIFISGRSMPWNSSKCAQWIS